VFNERVGITLTEQGERQPGKVRIGCAGVMCSTDTREQLVTELQWANTPQPVNKHDNVIADVAEDDLRVELDQPLAVTQYGLVLPPGLQVESYAKLSQQPICDAVVPAARISTTISIANLCQVEDGNLESVRLEFRRGRRDQAGLAAALGRDDMCITAGSKRVVQHPVGLPRHVTRTHSVQWLPQAEELARDLRPVIVPVAGLFFSLISHVRYLRIALRYSVQITGAYPVPQSGKLLKKDQFGEIWRIYSGEQSLILRDTAAAGPLLRPVARWLMRREARSLAALDGLDGVPEVLALGRDTLQRSFIDGDAMQRVRPHDKHYFRAAMRLLRQLHRAGVTHNDLAKEPNLLVRSDGSPAFIDFQLASFRPRRGRLFRLLAREDIRHLLKHKRTYRPQDLTRREQAILDAPTLPSRIYMATVKPAYLFVTRRLMGWSDREGAHDRGSKH